MEELDILDGLEVDDGVSKRKVEKDGDRFKVHFTGSIDSIIEGNERLRNEAHYLAKPKYDQDGLIHLARIPKVLVDLWISEGFNIFSAEKSGMTPEEHQRELMKRINQYNFTNVSKFNRL